MWRPFSTPRIMASAAFSGLTACFSNPLTALTTRGSVRSTPTMSTVPTSGVATAPGHTSVTPMSCAARSKRRTSLTPRRPNFAALYGACSGRPNRPAAELTLTTCPPRPASIIAGTNACMTWMGPMRSTSTVRRQWARSRSWMRPHVEMPATFMTTSTAPTASCARPAKATTASASVRSSASWCATRSPWPASARRAIVPARPSAWMSVSTSRPPRWATSRAVARPMPLPAPVTRVSAPVNLVLRTTPPGADEGWRLVGQAYQFWLGHGVRVSPIVSALRTSVASRRGRRDGKLRIRPR